MRLEKSGFTLPPFYSMSVTSEISTEPPSSSIMNPFIRIPTREQYRFLAFYIAQPIPGCWTQSRLRDLIWVFGADMTRDYRVNSLVSFATEDFFRVLQHNHDPIEQVKLFVSIAVGYLLRVSDELEALNISDIDLVTHLSYLIDKHPTQYVSSPSQTTAAALRGRPAAITRIKAQMNGAVVPAAVLPAIQQHVPPQPQPQPQPQVLPDNTKGG